MVAKNKKGPRGVHVGRKHITLSTWSLMNDPAHKSKDVGWEDVWAYYKPSGAGRKYKKAAFGPCIIGMQALLGDIGFERHLIANGNKGFVEDRKKDLAILEGVLARLKAGEDNIIVHNDDESVPNVYIQGAVNRQTVLAFMTYYFQRIGFANPVFKWAKQVSSIHFYPSFNLANENGDLL